MKNPFLDKIISDVRGPHKDALVVVGGGYLRDTILGRPPKDIDVFVHGVPEMDLVDRLGATQHFGVDYKPQHAHLDFVVDWERPLGLFDMHREVQIIGLRDNPGDLFGVLDRFDLGICQVGYCSNQGLQWTDAFQRDVSGQSISVTFGPEREDHYRKHSAGRVKRLLGKYPEAVLVDPRGLLTPHLAAPA